jgi:adenylate cyclase
MNIIMEDNHSENPLPSSSMGELVVDTETLVSQTQNRMWSALKGNYRYNSSLKDSQAFLFNHVNSKISLVIMYADLVGSTNMSMTLPVDKMVAIIYLCVWKYTDRRRGGLYKLYNSM